MSLIACRDITKIYEGSAEKALDEVAFSVEGGHFVTITGKSGSGKTTLMNILTGIDRPTSGEVVVAGQQLSLLDETRLSQWRGRTVGVVFQFFQLLPTLTIAENVILPMEFCRLFRPRERSRRAHELLERFGIADQADKLPHSLSGGQQQRAAIARALANDPPLIAADEPTGNLDSQTSEVVLGLFSELVAAGKTVVMITHEADYGRYATRSLALKDGRLVGENGDRA
jgi:putative ABC transport system ATP-binding protein